ncbi:MAG TPA: hypothetical protein PLR04_00810, partial [Bacilli bacterium]|nr:hypothetical protein [Bacilli bacterium]
LAILCLSTAASVTGTVAWFAANNVVSASNLIVHANTQASLVIDDDFPTEGRNTSIAFIDSSLGLDAATRWNGTGEITGGILQYVSNGSAIDPLTGLQRTNVSDPQYAELVYASGSENQHWKDYVVFIASDSESRQLLPNEYFEASVTFTGAQATTYATSIDFHVELGTITAGLGDFKDTINAAGTVASANHGAFAAATGSKFSTELLTGIPLVGEVNNSPTIPVAGSGAAGLKVTMRVYIDGALQKSSTEAYVLTDEPWYGDISMSVSFALRTRA